MEEDTRSDNIRNISLESTTLPKVFVSMFSSALYVCVDVYRAHRLMARAVIVSVRGTYWQ